MQDCHLLEGAPRSGEDRPLRSKGAARGGILQVSQIRPLQGLGFSAKIRYPPSPAATPPSFGRGLTHYVMQQW